MDFRTFARRTAALLARRSVLRTCAALLIAFPLAAPARAQMGGMEGMDHDMGVAMVGPLGIPMDRMGSGTTWIPDAVPVPSRTWMLGSWHVMAHGVAWLEYDYQDGPRGDDRFGSLNWGMLMASRELLGGYLQPRVMLSLDPLTMGNRGYPLLLQSGEVYRGNAIRDRQHPHDFFMELAMLYERQIAPGLGISLYGAPSGEPALGPVAFMHRPSALDNPFAPLSHHWQDATHVSFGVLSAGLFGRSWKLEGSAFNGREPDEHRWGIDEMRLDSYSGRLTVNPTASLSATAGFGRLETPEILHPEESLHRATASVLYSHGGEGTQWATAAVWGMNAPIGHEDAEEEHQSTHAFLLETSLTEGSSTVLGRLEYVEKSAEELVVPPSSGVLPERVFGVVSFSLGYVHDLGRFVGLSGGLGALGTVNLLDEALEPFYGSRRPVGGAVFLRVRPARGEAEPMTHDHGAVGLR